MGVVNCKVDRLQKLHIPSVEHDDVKVKVLAAPVNPSDVNVIQGEVTIATIN